MLEHFAAMIAATVYERADASHSELNEIEAEARKLKPSQIASPFALAAFAHDMGGEHLAASSRFSDHENRMEWASELGKISGAWMSFQRRQLRLAL